MAPDQRNYAHDGGPIPMSASVARTMSEQGDTCDMCTHLWGRHHVTDGCITKTRVGKRRPVRCGCQEQPATRATGVTQLVSG